MNQVAASGIEDARMLSDIAICDQVNTLAEQLLSTALAEQTAKERDTAAEMGRMMNDPHGKSFLFAMVDQVFRSHDPAVSARRWRQLLDKLGVPSYLKTTDQWLMRLGSLASRFVPSWVMPAIAERMRSESSRVILSGDEQPMHAYLAARRKAGFRINLNQLGEAVLGEQEANHRRQAILKHLADPEVTYISVKISAIFSQINMVAWDDTLLQIKERLRKLYRAALHDHKFVNLDMEEYRDLELTIAAFREVLDEPEFMQLTAGIVLQAYLPDSVAAQEDLTTWAKRRVARGGAPIKIRLVKGANLAMERVEAEMHGWHQAPYSTKAETDANFRRLLEYGCQRENARAVRLGVASHNLFDVALALTLRRQYGVEDRVEIEMLEGMANIKREQYVMLRTGCYCMHRSSSKMTS